jgi:CubicO group peptidase (beta-lactamase class C family)
MTRPLHAIVAAVCATLLLTSLGSGQGLLPYSMFERYLEALRQQSGIPGLSAAIIKDGRVEWESGFGHQNLDGMVAATPDTPYPIGGLTEITSAVLIGLCADRGTIDLDDPIRQWVSDFPHGSATIRTVLAHADGGPASARFQYDPARYAALTNVAEDCSDEPFSVVMGKDVLDRLGMSRSVPGTDLANPSNAAREHFDARDLQRYQSVLADLAVPYRVDRSLRATRNEDRPRGLNAAEGLVSTVRDLVRLDRALDQGVLLRPDTLSTAWTPARFGGEPLPTGLGWFVQPYQGERLVWQFSHDPDRYSALILKLPARRLTLIMLANSDGLNTGANLERGDVTTSPFVKIFLRLFA